MANIRKRGNSYQIRVSAGYDRMGNQVSQSMTWKPNDGMTQKQIQKEVQRQAVLFEETCMKGQVTTAVKFEEFSKQWFKEYAEIKLKIRTLQNYHWLERRVYKAIGHMRMDRITPRHIQKFIVELTESKREDGLEKNEGKLSAKTIKLHISFISTVFDYAVKIQMATANPCKNVALPKVIQQERDIYSLEEAQQLINLLLQEEPKNLKFVVFYILAIFTGFRRGELLGLEWQDIDFENNVITIRRTSNTTPKNGTYTDTPKTATSRRCLKVSSDVMEMIFRFKEQQDNEKTQLGDKWVDCNRLFTRWDGQPMFPNTPGLFFERFCKRTGIRYVSNHSFRHLNASVMIYNGVDVKTVQSALGHSSPNTTLSLYVHTFQAAQARAMDVISNTFSLKKAKTSE